MKNVPTQKRNDASRSVPPRPTLRNRAARAALLLPRMPYRCFVAWMIALGCLAGAVPAAEPDRAGIEFFEAKIRPVLVEHCYQCHSAKAAVEKKLKGGLLVDSRDGLAKGGDSGPAVVAGKPEASLLWKALRYESFEMPPKGKLPNATVDDFATWIKMGAPDPRGGDLKAPAAGVDIEKGRQHWAFQKPKLPDVPKVVGADQPIDAFVRAKLAEKGLTASAQVDRRTLGRRITFDLIGLPPEPEALDEFVADPSPDAVAKLVDHCLVENKWNWRFWPSAGGRRPGLGGRLRRTDSSRDVH